MLTHLDLNLASMPQCQPIFQIEAKTEFLKPGKNGTFYFCILNLNLGSDKKDGTIEMRSIERGKV